MRDRRHSALLLLVAAAVLAVGPSLSVRAASPCGPEAEMTCCAEMGTGGASEAPPCGCTLKPVTPSPAVVEAAAPPVVALVDAPAGEVPAPEARAEAGGPAVPPRARAGPLFLLHSSLLN